jgi:hypothetical protein
VPFLSVAATQEMRSKVVQGLPPGVLITFGSTSRLEVEFKTLEELAEKLIHPGLALDRNFDYLRLPCSKPGPIPLLQPKRSGAAGCGVLQESCLSRMSL